jgi:FkbM family methyltransferase
MSEIINLITFKLPYHGIYEMTRICGKRRSEVWNRLPFKNIRTPSILPDGNMIICSLEDHSYEWEIYHNSPYDQYFIPQKGDIVVDAGAHVGFYTLKAAKEVGNEGHVIAVEPEYKNYELLVLNIRINKYNNVTPVKSALSDFEGKSTLYLKARSCSHSLIGKTWITPIVGATEVTVTTLDKLFEKLNIKKLNILKVNVEGAELHLLKGSKKFLSTGSIDKIVVTSHPPFKEEARKIKRYLKAHGYRVVVSNNARILYAFHI